MVPFDDFLMRRVLLQVGGAIAIAIILGVFVIAYNATYTTVMRLDQQTDEAWTRVVDDMVERYRDVPALAVDLGPSLGPDASAVGEVMRDLDRLKTALSAGEMGGINAATTDLESSLSSLTAVLEAHPEISASGEVRGFMAALERTDQAISDDRVAFNERVWEYNREISSFPGSLWSDNWGLSPREYFTARIGNGDPPPVPAG
jgi:LemA protein